MAFICFNGLHGILDDSVGLALSFSAAAIMWSSIAVHYSLKATRILVVYSYSAVAFMILFSLFLLIQVLMFLAAEIVWILEGHFYESMGGPYISRAVSYITGPLWDDISGLARRTFVYYFSGAVEYHEEREYHRKKVLDYILQPVCDEVLNEVILDMAMIMSEDSAFWFSEAGKDWDKEGRMKINVTRSELDNFLENTERQLADLRSEQERLQCELDIAKRERVQETREYWICHDALQDIIACLEDKKLMEEEARRLWLLNWHSGWTAKCNTDKVHYNSLDHVYLFGGLRRGKSTV